jgi:hypothetical protein
VLGVVVGHSGLLCVSTLCRPTPVERRLSCGNG